MGGRWKYVEQSLLSVTGDALALGATHISVELDRMVFERYGDLRTMAQVMSNHMDGHGTEHIDAYLKRMRETYGIYHWLGVADRHGRIIASSFPALTGTDVSRRPWFVETRSRARSQPDATFLGQVEAFVTGEGGPDSIAFSAAISDDNGDFLGVVTSRVSIPALEAMAAEVIRGLQTRNSTLADIQYVILDNNGRAYIDSDLAHKGLTDFSAFQLPSVELARRGLSGFVEEDHQRRHEKVMTGYSRTHGWGQPDPFHWTVLIRMPTASLVAPIQIFHFKIGAAGLAILIPIFWLLFWMQQRLRKEWRIAQGERLRAGAAQAQYHLLLQTTDQGIFGLDGEGRCTFINRAAARMLGYDAAELLGQRLHDRLHTEHCGACTPALCPILRVLSTGRSERLTELRFCRKDGLSFDVECSAFPLDEADRTKLVFTFMEIAERKQRTEALLQYQVRLQSLAAQLRKTEEHVRQNLATELHDNLAQTLALCQMKLASLSRTVPQQVATSLVSVSALVKEALGYTRHLMSDLRPPTLGNEGDLAAAVRWVTAKLERHGLAVTVIDDHKPKPLDPDILRIAHQSLHELLFNVLKHSGTTAAKVRLRRLGRTMAIQVLDRGLGIAQSGYKTPTQQGGFGLFNMREQIAGAGGLMRLSSLREGGTRATILLPLRVPQPSHAPVTELVSMGSQSSAVRSSLGHSPQVRILLVDDHQIMRQGLRTMIEAETGYEVVAEAVDGEMAVELATTLHPDVILMDINMPKLNGIEATRRIKGTMDGRLRHRLVYARGSQIGAAHVRSGGLRLSLQRHGLQFGL